MRRVSLGRGCRVRPRRARRTELHGIPPFSGFSLSRRFSDSGFRLPAFSIFRGGACTTLVVGSFTVYLPRGAAPSPTDRHRRQRDRVIRGSSDLERQPRTQSTRSLYLRAHNVYRLTESSNEPFKKQFMKWQLATILNRHLFLDALVRRCSVGTSAAGDIKCGSPMHALRAAI